MKKITLLFIFLLISSIGFSQEIIQSFEAAGAINGGPFGGMAAPSVIADAGTNGTQVLEIVANPANEVWQGINLFLTKNVDLTSTQTMSIDVFSATPVTFLVKVNGGIAGAPEAAAEVTHNGNSTWQTLSFTFNTSLDGKAAAANGVYSAFVIHAYWAAGATMFTEVTKDTRTFYVDNIFGIAAAPVADPAPTTAAPTPPARPAADVISIYSGSYAAIPGIFLDQGWCGANSITATTAGGNDVLAYNNQPCQGIDFDLNRQNFTGITNLHVDLFIAAGTDLVGKVFNVKIVPDAGADSEFNIDINALAPAPVPGTWYSYDMPITISGPHSSIRQVGVTSNLNNVLWYDNFYFHKNTITLSTEDLEIAGLNVYPNPTKDSWTVKTKNIKMSSIEVFDILGKQVLSLKPETTETTINASQLKSGLYFAKISTDNGSSSLKLVKQ